jgi:hypothetical protein
LLKKESLSIRRLIIKQCKLKIIFENNEKFSRARKFWKNLLENSKSLVI